MASESSQESRRMLSLAPASPLDVHRVAVSLLVGPQCHCGDRVDALNKIARDKAVARAECDLIMQLLDDEEGRVRAAAVNACESFIMDTHDTYEGGCIVDTKRLPSAAGDAIVACLQDPHYLVRMAAINILSTEPFFIVHCASMLAFMVVDERSPSLRRAAVSALATVPKVLYKYRDVVRATKF